MNRELARRLLLYIIDQLQDMEAPISTIRLIKFLYLIDLEYYGLNYQTLTGINWIKYYHGPYFFELPEIIRASGLDLETEEVKTEHGLGKTFRVYEEHDISTVVPFRIKVLIDDTLKRWAYEEIDDLLTYVYDTAPVKYSEHRQQLDFTYETDHLLLEEARETADDFITLDELISDYEMYVGCDE